MTGRHLLIGIDVGGTFTDAVAYDSLNRKLVTALKLPSTPDDPGKAVVSAIERIAESVAIQGSVVFHGTTVGTNTLIERKGAKTALLATRGFTDVIELRRQARPNLYDFNVRISQPLVPSDLRFGIVERLAADGTVVEPLQPMDVTESLRAAGVEAVAVSFLHSYVSSEHEERIVALIRDRLPGVFVSRSSEVCPEFREYERTSTTVVNAYIGPAVGKYMTELDASLRAKGVERLMVVKSNGGLTSPENALRFPVHLIESGPAAQLIASAAFARMTSRLDLVSFDMGGTTAKAGLIQNGKPEVTAEFYADHLVEGRDVGGYAIRSAVLDLVEIGAGGGSIAWVDEAKVLKVGPRSAGALPGPACYGRGGTLPTVTDAHAVIGTLTPDLFKAPGVAFDRDLAVAAVKRHVAEPFGWNLGRAAYAIIDIAVANMAEMVRLATSRKGFDPRNFAILASGGAGPLHVAAVGEQIGATEVIIPPYPGMFSAFGATFGAVRHELTRTFLSTVTDMDVAQLESAFAGLRAQADEILRAEPRGVAPPRMQRFLEARFMGQLFELKVPLGEQTQPFPPPAEIDAAFRKLYNSEYGFDLPDVQVQVVNLRLVVEIDLGHHSEDFFACRDIEAKEARAARSTPILLQDDCTISMPVFRIEEVIGCRIEGPAIIEHSGSTVWMHEGQSARIGGGGEVFIKLADSTR